MTTNAAGTWWESAACRSADPELFFPVSGTGRGHVDTAAAKAVCGTCMIRRKCLDYAVECGPVHGVWGGTSEDERRRLASDRRKVADHVRA
jgi:WhiB family redox-sensing transcriptional regulator